MWQVCRDFLAFLKQEKRWWLVPLVIIAVLFLAVFLLSSGSALSPFMYSTE